MKKILDTIHRVLQKSMTSLKIGVISMITISSAYAQCTAPIYTEGGGYLAGSQVTNGGNKYECKPWPNSGWCNGAAWAYAPGTGTYWTQAWNLVGPCNPNVPPRVYLTSPVAGTVYYASSALTVSANAADSDGSISKVEFFNGTAKLGEDLTSPYTYTWNSVPAGTYSITAKATDNLGGQTTSIPVSAKVVATNVVADITELQGFVNAQYSDSPKNEEIVNLTDNQSSTKFQTFHNAAWVQFQQANNSVVTKYTITSANDASNRDPSSWTFQGSSNGTTWTTLDSRSNVVFASRLLKKTYTFTNMTAYKYYRLNLSNNNTALHLAEWEIFGTGGGGYPTPPATWQEDWAEHDQLLNLHYYDNDVAIYFDSDVSNSITWVNQYLHDVWVYTKNTYGSFGRDPRLFAIFHDDKYGSGGYPVTYFDASHLYRSAIGVGGGPWEDPGNETIDVPMHEIGHLVEGSSKNTHESPAFPLWEDSKWCEIYMYDVYVNLGKTADATRWYNHLLKEVADYPRAGSYWFRDWFYPIYSTYGGNKVLNNYFTLLSQCFPKNGNSYARNLNWGEFIHFWSGAAGTNLKSLTTNAFGWTAEWETQFRQAQTDFPCITYANSTARLDNAITGTEEAEQVTARLDNAITRTEEAEQLSAWYNGDAKIISITDLNATEELTGEVTLYSMTGVETLRSPLTISNGVGFIDASGIPEGIYVVTFNGNGKVFRKKVMIKP